MSQPNQQRHAAAGQVLYDFDFDWRYMVRGLTIDKRRGNVLKLDRHKYVKLAYHGFQKLSREQRLAIYANALVRSLLRMGFEREEKCSFTGKTVSTCEVRLPRLRRQCIVL